MIIVSRNSDDALSRVFFFFLKLAVFSDSSFLTMTMLSLYGFICGVAHVPKKRTSAAKSLLHYGVSVIQKKLAHNTRAS